MEFPPDWNIPWAGIGALLMGLGSVLSGWAALKLARGEGVKDEDTPSGSDGG